MSAYLGNPSLSAAVKDRVSSTFQQTIALYKQGRLDEVAAGCNLMLQMDPLFEPARKLLDKSRNPNLPIDVDSLVSQTSADDAMQQAHAAMARRDFQRVVHLTTEILTNDLMNDDARILGDQAREKLEAVPFVEQFLKKCEQQLASGNVTAARAGLEKARALDEDHPAVAKMQQMIAQRESPSPSGFVSDQRSPSFVVDNAPSTSTRGAAQASDFGFTFEEEKPAAPSAPAFGGFAFDSPAQPQPPAQPGGFGGGGFSFDTPSQPKPAPPAPAPPKQQAPSPQPPAQQGGGFGSFSFDSPAQPSSGSSAGGFSDFSFGTPAPAPPPPPADPFAGGFSFDTPSAAPTTSAFSFDQSAAAPPGGDFDFSTASIETSPDDQRKIQQYLADGDRAFNAADYQQAIDLWSRIFLIDVTNEQASERIERAKLKRREIEQKSEAVIGAGIQAYERKDYDAARARFREVLNMDPSNVPAQDYLERIDEASAPLAPAMGAFIPPPPAPDLSPSIFDDDSMSGGYEAPLVPPDMSGEMATSAAITPPSPQANASRKAAAAAKPATAKKPLPIALISIVVAVLVLGAGGWFAWSKFSAKPAADPEAAQAIFRQAQSLSAKGKYDQAILALQEVKADDPQHDRALNMIADLQHKRLQAAEMVEGRPAAVVYQEALANGKMAFEAHDYDAAKKALDDASRIRALPPDMKSDYDIAAQQVAKLGSAKQLFAEQKYQDAIVNLQALLVQDPQNKSILRMINSAHFNLGAMALQQEKMADATKEFDHVLAADPTDELAKRSKELAARYSGQSTDLLYKIYVKYLPLRQAG